MLKVTLPALAVGLISAVAAAQQPPRPDPGLAVYKKANCVGCHKWHGGGGGGYGGDALSLRHTQLTREQIIETVNCGRPGTGMPFHLRGAYDATKCYDSLRAEMGAQMPPEGTAFLRQSEVEAVATYVAESLKGKGEPTLADCTAFFGDTSRACDLYRKETRDGTPAPQQTTH
ncbi:c-type cytochrome [Methylobacterium oryzihabitans]|uniref:C-type cytochrome n=1 Tax=Methylobacterium oryzihabitans TaxID=2499852 RepID=A0A437NUU6_9HYPH|nr:c-type cytochrome [Methylobacterium oryzihabitans]RVU13819.1 c-type cytochrome [Methylobacterium oryzihabitans]